MDIVKTKAKDFNARNNEAAFGIIAGTARQMGLEIEGQIFNRGIARLSRIGEAAASLRSRDLWGHAQQFPTLQCDWNIAVLPDKIMEGPKIKPVALL